MKQTCLAVIAGFVVSGYAQAQAVSAAEKVVSRACKAEGDRLCAGKTGQDLTQCLQNNKGKLGANCKDAVSKLPKPKL